MSKSAFTPTSGQIISGLDLAYYEIQQLALLFHVRLLDLGVLNNARIEATLIHLRILLDFFERKSERREQDDVLAEDCGFAPAQLLVSVDARRRMNKYLAHLTYSRLDRNKVWDFDQMLRPVLERAREFASHVLRKRQYVADAKSRTQWEGLERLIEVVLARPSSRASKGKF